MAHLLGWWLMLEVIGLISLPLAFALFSRRLDHGYAFSKMGGILAISWVGWMLAHSGAMGLSSALWAALALFVALNAALAWRNGGALRAWLAADGWGAILRLDLAWSAGFLFFAWQRALAPEIFGAEKYMDFAFLNSLARIESLPPADPWMAGETINYYYFGYLLLANLWRFATVDYPVAYNLCVAMLGGLAFAEFVALGRALTQRWVFGLAAGLFGMLVTNLDAFSQWLSKGTLLGLDYWASTRVVGDGDTINEFPYFTVVHGDLHPHFIVMPVALMLLALLLDPQRRRPFVEGALAWSDMARLAAVAFVYGAAITISPWELPVGGLMIFLLLQRDLPLWPPLGWARLRLGLLAVGVLVVAYGLYLPFHLNFETPDYGGVGFKLASTNLGEFLTVFAILLSPGLLLLPLETRPTGKVSQDALTAIGLASLLGLLVAYLMGNAVILLLLLLLGLAVAAVYANDDVEQRSGWILFAGAIIMLLLCELIYLKDPYGDRLYRMNTVFKFYLQSWLLLAVAGAWCLQRLLARGGATAVVGGVTVTALALAGCVYPLSMTLTRQSYKPAAWDLDGNEYLRREHPEDYALITWLRDNVEGMPVVLETSGNPYSYYARISSNVGLPTLMGWANHEGLWRSHDTTVGARQAEVARIYNAPTLAEVEPLLEKYGVRYIVVGELERKDHAAAGLEKFASLPVAFRHGQSVLYVRE